MKTINNVRDLLAFGVDALTGESDTHMYRVLCDVTRRGKAIIERVMDIQLTLHDAWNPGTKDDPHIGSLLLPYEFVPPIAVFTLLSDTDTSEVWLMKGGSVFGFGVEDTDEKETLRKYHEKDLRHVFYPRPCDRNRHAFTGRTS